MEIATPVDQLGQRGDALAHSEFRDGGIACGIADQGAESEVLFIQRMVELVREHRLGLRLGLHRILDEEDLVGRLVVEPLQRSRAARRRRRVLAGVEQTD